VATVRSFCDIRAVRPLIRASGTESDEEFAEMFAYDASVALEELVRKKVAEIRLNDLKALAKLPNAWMNRVKSIHSEESENYFKNLEDNPPDTIKNVELHYVSGDGGIYDHSWASYDEVIYDFRDLRQLAKKELSRRKAKSQRV